MNVNDLTFDVAYRLGYNDDKARAHLPAIVRAMNRVYHQLNRETRALVKQLDMDFSALDPLVQYWSVPTDMITPFRIEPHRNFKAPQEMVLSGETLSEQDDVWTMFGGRLYFSNVAADTHIYLWYYASGMTLVNAETDDLSANEVNAPEWPWEHIHEILAYGTAIELRSDYAQFQMDLLIFRQMKEELEKMGRHFQLVTPSIMGGWGLPTQRENDYGEKYL